MNSSHSHGHSHGAVRAGHERVLWIALGLTTTFMAAEVVGALITQSLALLSDAAHMFTDSAALAVSLAAIWIAKRAADHKRTFGYYRFEILAAAFNAVLLFLVALYILFEAYQRLRAPAEIQSLGMLVIASIGLVVNVVAMRLLRAGSTESLNVKGAYLEVWSDLLGSVGVIVAAIIIGTAGWTWVDSLVAAGIGLWVLPRTWTLLKESINILLQGVPEGVDVEELEAAIRGVAGVTDLHNLHVWGLTSGKTVMSAHVIVDPASCEERQVIPAITELVEHDFGIGHSTVQVEIVGVKVHCG
ncbi:MAG TPA: cation diffusion facilitator family transporter [Casimicrobiaceae bacterium]